MHRSEEATHLGWANISSMPGTLSGNFFYTWTELSVPRIKWLRLGLVIDRTKAFASDIEIRRGPLLRLHLQES